MLSTVRRVLETDGAISGNRQELIVLLARIWTRRRIVALTCIFLFAASAAYVAMRTPVYAVKSTIEIGTFGAPANYRVIETPDAVINKINRVYAESTAQILSVAGISATEHTVANTPQFDIVARPVRKSNSIFIVEGRGTTSQLEVLKSVEQRIVDTIIAEHSRLLDVARSDLRMQIKQVAVELDRLDSSTALDIELGPLRAELSKAERELSALRDDTAFAESTKAVHNEIGISENALRDLEAENKLLAITLKQKDVIEAQIKVRLDHLEKQLGADRFKYQKIAKKQNPSSDAMGAMLLGTGLISLETEYYRLKDQLSITLPLDRRRLENEIASNIRRQSVPMNAIEITKSSIKTRQIDRENKIAAAEQTIIKMNASIANIKEARNRAKTLNQSKLKDLETKADSITATRLVSPPILAKAEGRMSGPLLMVLGSFFGLGLGCMLALAADLADQVRGQFDEHAAVNTTIRYRPAEFKAPMTSSVHTTPAPSPAPRSEVILPANRNLGLLYSSAIKEWRARKDSNL